MRYVAMALTACVLGISAAASAQDRPLELIVQYRENGPTSVTQAQRELSVAPMSVETLDLIKPGKRILEFATQADLDRAAAQLRSDPDVEYVEQAGQVKIQFVPNDPSYPQQYDKAIQRLNIASDLETGDENVIVLISDTTFDCTIHPDLAPNCRQDLSRNFISDLNINDHGYHVAGIVAAAIDNGIGIAGTAGTASIAMARFLNGAGSGSDADGLRTWQYALELDAQGYRVIVNSSWGGGAYLQSLVDAAAAMRAAGVFNFAAAGNNNSNNCTTPFYPAVYPNVVSVASTDQNDARSSFSNYGVCPDAAPSVELAAPGTSILSTCSGSTYCTKSGTSMATPQVAGAAALILSQDPDVSYEEMLDRLTLASVPRSLPVVSEGRIDLPNALVEPAPGLQVSMQCPTPTEVDQDETLRCAVSMRGVGGFTGTANLSCGGVPGATCSVSPSTISVGGTAELSLTPSRNTPPLQLHTVTVTASSEVGQDQANAAVRIWPFGTEVLAYTSTQQAPIGKPVGCFPFYNCTPLNAATSINVEEDLEVLQLSGVARLTWDFSYASRVKISLMSPSGTLHVIKPLGGSGKWLTTVPFSTTAFDGEPTKGQWTLLVEIDPTFKMLGGTLNGWDLSIMGFGDGGSDPPPPPAPTVNFPATSFSWQATNADSCTASGAWSGTKPASGTHQVTDPVSGQYNLTCTGPGGQVQRSIATTVSPES